MSSSDPILQNLNRRFDHTSLKSDLDAAGIEHLCEEARQYSFYSVCINPVWVSLATRLLKDSDVRITTVCGFPLGANRTDIKAAEAAKGIADGAHEIDMVANIAWLKTGDISRAAEEIRVVRGAMPGEAVLKVIIECALLTPDRQREAVKAVIDGGAEFVKTGTGFCDPVTVKQVRTLHEAAAGQIMVKAAGGIRTLAQCRKLLAAGADRLGCSSSAAIIRELAAEESA